MGETVLLPDAATAPIPWSILTDVAPVTAHCSVEDPPVVMESGFAVNAEMTGTLAEVTVTVAVAVTEPEVLVAVSV